MSALITDKLVTPCGDTTTAAAGGYLDAAGNVVGSPGFLPNYVIDYAGNMGAIPSVTGDCTLIATIIGSALPPGDWEMQVGTVETVGLNNGTISANFAANATPTPLSSFVSLNATGYIAGVISGIGTWTIRSGPDSIDGTNYLGAGLLVVTGDNTHTGPITMQTGTKLQFGADCSNATTRAKGVLNIGEGAVATQFTSFTSVTALTQALNNNGTYNIIGCGECGAGGENTSLNVNNNGTVNIDKAYWRNTSTWAGTGTINVKAGGTFGVSNVSVANTTRINLNGNGWKNASCVEQGALHARTGGATIGARINVQSASTIKTATGVNVTYSGALTGSAPLTVTTLSATKPNGSTAFSSTENTYNGTITVDGTTLNQSNGLSLQYAKIVLVNDGLISTNGTQTIGSLESSDPDTQWFIGGSNNVFIKNNGITQFDGSLTMTGSIANVWLEGGSGNQLTLTKVGQTATLYARNGSKLILQGATFLLGGSGGSGQARISAGSTISAGTSTTAAVTYLSIDAESGLDVRASGAGTGKLTVGNLGFALTAGWKVNALDALAPGTYPIIQKPNTALITVPTLGINNTGGTVTFTQVGNVLNMIVT